MLCSLSCSRPSKLLDLKADSSGGPNRLSEPDAVELNLTESREETRDSQGERRSADDDDDDDEEKEEEEG